MGALFPPLASPDAKEAIRFGERALTYEQLAGVAAALAAQLDPSRPVAVWAVSELETCRRWWAP